jgi:hypothetical protein
MELLLNSDSATVTITDEQSVPTVTLTGTTVAENAAGVATLQLLFLQLLLKLL